METSSRHGSVTSQFVESEGDTYYFDADGNKVTGEKQIGFYDCVFDEEGKMESRESRLDPNKPMMALTFDDGPGERTGELLDVDGICGGYNLQWAWSSGYVAGYHAAEAADRQENR